MENTIKLGLLTRCGMFRVKTFLVALICAWPFGVSASTVSPEPVTISLEKNAGWSEFRFDLNDRDGVWLDAIADPRQQRLGALSFTVSLQEKATLEVTDAFRWGDVFSVFANGKLLGHTTEPESNKYSGDDYFNDYTAAHNDPSWSSGTWHLAPGDYVITGFVTKMPEIRGRAALRLIDFKGTDRDAVFEPEAIPSTTTVPLPGTLSLMFGAGAVSAALSRRRTNKKERKA